MQPDCRAYVIGWAVFGGGEGEGAGCMSWGLDFTLQLAAAPSAVSKDSNTLTHTHTFKHTAQTSSSGPSGQTHWPGIPACFALTLAPNRDKLIINKIHHLIVAWLE